MCYLSPRDARRCYAKLKSCSWTESSIIFTYCSSPCMSSTTSVAVAGTMPSTVTVLLRLMAACSPVSRSLCGLSILHVVSSAPHRERLTVTWLGSSGSLGHNGRRSTLNVGSVHYCFVLVLLHVTTDKHLEGTSHTQVIVIYKYVY